MSGLTDSPSVHLTQTNSKCCIGSYCHPPEHHDLHLAPEENQFSFSMYDEQRLSIVDRWSTDPYLKDSKPMRSIRIDFPKMFVRELQQNDQDTQSILVDRLTTLMSSQDHFQKEIDSPLYLNMFSENLDLVFSNFLAIDALCSGPDHLLPVENLIISDLTRRSAMNGIGPGQFIASALSLPTLIGLGFKDFALQPKLIFFGDAFSSFVFMWRSAEKIVLCYMNSKTSEVATLNIRGSKMDQIHSTADDDNVTDHSSVPTIDYAEYEYRCMSDEDRATVGGVGSIMYFADRGVSRGHTHQTFSFKKGTLLRGLHYLPTRYLVHRTSHVFCLQTRIVVSFDQMKSPTCVDDDYCFGNFDEELRAQAASVMISQCGKSDLPSASSSSAVVHLTKQTNTSNGSTTTPKLTSQVDYNIKGEVHHIHNLKNNYKNVSVAAKDIYNPKGYLGFKVTQDAHGAKTLTMLKITPGAYIGHHASHVNKYRANTAIVVANYKIEKLAPAVSLSKVFPGLESLLRQRHAPHEHMGGNDMNVFKELMSHCPSCCRTISPGNDEHSSNLVQLMPCQHLLCDVCMLEYNKICKSSDKSELPMHCVICQTGILSTLRVKTTPIANPAPVETNGVFEYCGLRLTPVQVAFTSVHSARSNFQYPTNERLIISNFDPNLNVPCAPGIHFCMRLIDLSEFLGNPKSVVTAIPAILPAIGPASVAELATRPASKAHHRPEIVIETKVEQMEASKSAETPELNDIVHQPPIVVEPERMVPTLYPEIGEWPSSFEEIAPRTSLQGIRNNIVHSLVSHEDEPPSYLVAVQQMLHYVNKSLIDDSEWIPPQSSTITISEELIEFQNENITPPTAMTFDDALPKKSTQVAAEVIPLPPMPSSSMDMLMEELNHIRAPCRPLNNSSMEDLEDIRAPTHNLKRKESDSTLNQRSSEPAL
jgi:hypothetical protein